MIRINNLSKYYEKNCILKNISFTIDCGKCVSIVGKNGCGKTTLVKMLTGIEKSDGGSIEYFGNNVAKNKKLFGKYCGYVPQENPLIEELTVYENLQLWGAKKGADFDRLDSLFDLKDILNMPVHKLSGGMKRRLSIACAVINFPPILIMDEPAAALDMYYKKSILDFIQKYKNMNGIVIITTHDEDEIVFSDKCFIIENQSVEEINDTKTNFNEIEKRIIGTKNN